MSYSNVRKYLFSSSNLLLVFGLLFILVGGYINIKTEKPILELSKQETALNINNDILVFMSAGNKRLLTDLLWVQTLLESDTEHYKQRDLNNWLFLRFNSIALLDPKFYENYLFGGRYLAIIKDDLEGADIIYDKGLLYYPDDFSLNYNAGFLNYFEIGNFEKGLRYLTKVENHPRSPIFIKSIINKLKLETGVPLEKIFQLVLFDYETTTDETLKNKLRNDLYRIKAEIDLECLNAKRTGCERIDFFGDEYIFKAGRYKSKVDLKPYRLKIREGAKSSLSP